MYKLELKEFKQNKIVLMVKYCVSLILHSLNLCLWTKFPQVRMLLFFANLNPRMVFKFFNDPSDMIFYLFT